MLHSVCSPKTGLEPDCPWSVTPSRLRIRTLQLTHDLSEGTPLPWQVLDDQDQRFARSPKIPRIFFSQSHHRQELPPHEPSQRWLSLDSACDSMSFRSRQLPPQGV